MDKEIQSDALFNANEEITFLTQEKELQASELEDAYTEIAFQIKEKGRRAAELAIANIELVFQNKEKEKRAAELIIANEALVLQNQEKEKRAAELIIANKELVFQNQEKEKRAAELIIANEALVFQNQEKEKRAAELSTVNGDLKNAEAAIRKLHDELEQKVLKRSAQYAFLSQVNQTIVHEKDAATLFRKSCDIALELGNYIMAWIGGFDIQQKQITLLSSCGIPEQDIKLFTHIPYETKAAQTHVLRTGTYYLCNDVETTFANENWKPFAEELNIGSFIVLPIKKSGHIFGTFNLYAAESNYFAADDIALLEEVTGDISFALDLFEKSERHKEAKLQLQKNFAELEAASNEKSAILNTLPAGIALIDNGGNIVKVNEEWIHFGKTNGMPDAYVPLNQNYITISENSSGAEAIDGRTMAQGLRDILNGERDHFTMEYPCDSPTEKRWYKTEVRPFKSNLLTGAVVMHMNISERKMAEAEMLLLINNTEEAFILVDKDLEIVSFNNQFKNLYTTYLGLDIQKGVSIIYYASKERQEIVASIYKKVLEGHVEESELMFPGFNNTTTYFSIKFSPAKDEFGTIVGAFVTAIDITEKKKAEAQKEFESKNKEALINSTDDLIWSISKDYKLIAANNSFIKEIKNYTGVELRQGDDLLIDHTYSADYIRHWKDLYKRAHTGETFKIEIYSPETTTRGESWTETNFSPIIVNEHIAGIACYSRNITERKKAELERSKITKDLLQRNRDLEQITFIISHNLRAPAANIKGFTEHLQDETITALEQQELLQGLAASVSGLDTIIKDINLILQVKQEINDKKELIIFSKLVKDIITSIGNTIDKHHVTITTDFEDVDDIFSLKVYLHSIFYNLISNSIKYRRPNVIPLIEIKSKRANGKIILTFKDNGMGFDINKKGDKVFGLYQRLHNHVEGKGMGLFMVKTQVEAIGGRITVSSELHKGTEFTIVFEN